jgi:acetylornithine deacetylase
MRADSMRPSVDEIEAAIKEDAVVELLQRLVRVPSVTGAEESMTDILIEELRTAGIEAEARSFADGQSNVHGFLDTGRPGPCLLLAGHIDTVGVEGYEEAWGDDPRRDPFSGAVVDGRVWGRGAADQKGGVAAVLGALHALQAARVPIGGQIRIALIGDEESSPGRGTSAGIKAYVDDVVSGDLRAPDFAIYTEPTCLDIYTSQIGFMIGTILVTGKASYFSKPWLGRDAIRDAHRVLEALYVYERRLAERTRHPKLGRPALLVTSIVGGEAFAVAERCSLNFIRSVPPSENFEEAKVELDEVLQRISIEYGVTVGVTYTSPRDSEYGGRPYEIASGSPIVDLLHRHAKTSAPASRLAGAPYWSEIGIIGSLGTDAVYFGPGDISICHTPFENVPVSDLVCATRTIARFAAEYLNDRPSFQQPT